MRTFSTRGPARLAVVLAGLAAVAAVPVALGADSSSTHVRGAAPGARGTPADDRAHAAVLTLYALETELTRARADVSAAAARRSSLARERASTRRQLAAARASMLVTERRLAELVRALYEQSGTDPLAVVLGADSLDEALTGLDSLGRAAGENSRVLERARAARRRLAHVDARLDRREAELRRASEAARARAGALEAKVAERAAFVASLRQREELTVPTVATLESRARTAERTSATLEAAPSATLEAAPIAARAAPVVAGSTLTVSAVGYSLPGKTASGLAVGHGIVAVDPSVIPLGTRMYVPGYGDAVAADTGGAVHGATIDLWFPSTAAALRWGRQTVTISLQ